MEMKCVLRERLYVPEDWVSPEDLEGYSYEFPEEVIEEDENGQAVKRRVMKQVNTHVRIKNPNDGKYYIGFARGNLEKLKSRFGQYEWDDRRARPMMTSNLQFREDRFLKTFEKDGAGQQELIDELLKDFRSGIIKAKPRFGKTVVTVYLATKLRLKTLITAHQEDLLEQFYEEFVAFTNLMEIQAPLGTGKAKKDARGRIVGFFRDYRNPEELDVCLLCWQTLGSKKGPERIAAHRDSFGWNVFDEVHRCGAYKYASVINSLNPLHRTGLTGTVERVDKKQKLALDIVGPVVARGRVREVPCVVTCIHTNVPINWTDAEPLPWLHKRIYNDMDYLRCVLKYLRQDVQDGFYVCIGFHRSSKAQLQEFADLLKHMGYRADAFYGDIDDRKDTLDRFRSGETQVAVCNEAMLTGVNVPRWNAYYVMFPTANVCYEEQLDGSTELSGNFVQNFSRPRTVFWYSDKVQKKVALIRDFVVENKKCRDWYRKRLGAYKHENFMIEHIYESFKRKEDICGNVRP